MRCIWVLDVDSANSVEIEESIKSPGMYKLLIHETDVSKVEFARACNVKYTPLEN